MRAKTRRTAIAVLPVLVAGLLALPVPVGAQTNLAPNPCFQRSVLEGSTTDSNGPLHGLIIQPGLPAGWAFEGSAGLFDYADTRADVLGIGGRTQQCGSLPRFAAVSIPASGKSDVCIPEADHCEDNVALNTAKSAVLPAFSVNPAWRNAVPIPVQSGRSYTLRAHTFMDFVSEDSGGAFIKIRWLDGLGAPIRVDAAHRTPPGSDGTDLSWVQMSLTRTAPPGAASAVLLLGYADDVWLGQVRFDNVFFG